MCDPPRPGRENPRVSLRSPNPLRTTLLRQPMACVLVTDYCAQTSTSTRPQCTQWYSAVQRCQTRSDGVWSRPSYFQWTRQRQTDCRRVSAWSTLDVVRLGSRVLEVVIVDDTSDCCQHSANPKAPKQPTLMNPSCHAPGQSRWVKNMRCAHQGAVAALCWACTNWTEPARISCGFSGFHTRPVTCATTALRVTASLELRRNRRGLPGMLCCTWNLFVWGLVAHVGGDGETPHTLDTVSCFEHVRFAVEMMKPVFVVIFR